MVYFYVFLMLLFNLEGWNLEFIENYVWNDPTKPNDGFLSILSL